MKIGVIGPESTVNVIKRVAERDLTSVQFHYCCSEFYEEAPDLAHLLQRDANVDALLFSGPTNFHYARRRVTPTIPWGYLPHNRTSILQALLEAVILHHSDLRSISVDRYDPELLRQVMEGAGLRDVRILRPSHGPEEAGFEKKLLEFHRDCYRQGLVSACFTSMEHILTPLLMEGIPCVRVYPAEEVVLEQIYHLQIQDLSARENHGKLAIIAIHFDYVLDEEENLMVREWEKMQYQNDFRERVYSAAQRMDAAVFGDGLDLFFLVTSRVMLFNIFFKQREHQKLLQFGQRTPAYKIWMGIGIGATMLECKSRAAMALNRSVEERSGTSYLAESEHEITGLAEYGGEPAGHSASYFARKIRVGCHTLEKIRQALDQGGNILTSQELARRMGITDRSVNRIIAQLEEAGCITIVGRRTAGRGRPARVMEITLPDSVKAPPAQPPAD